MRTDRFLNYTANVEYSVGNANIWPNYNQNAEKTFALYQKVAKIRLNSVADLHISPNSTQYTNRAISELYRQSPIRQYARISSQTRYESAPPNTPTFKPTPPIYTPTDFGNIAPIGGIRVILPILEKISPNISPIFRIISERGQNRVKLWQQFAYQAEFASTYEAAAF